MSEAEPAPAAQAPACPLPLSAVPANFQKHVDPAAPVPLRMMGAKALVPMGPKEMCTALYMLTFDAEAGVRETAAKSATGLQDRILSVALRDETMDAPVLAYYTGLPAGTAEYIENVDLNPAQPDTHGRRRAERPGERAVQLAI